MVLIVGDFPYLYALWDDLLTYMATVVLCYGCGRAHGILGILLMQYLKREKKPTNSTQANGTPPANAGSPDNDLGARQPTPPPMPRAEPTARVLQTIPPAISIGFGETTYRYHNAISPCLTHQEYERNPAYKTKRFTPCKNCYPEVYPR